MSDGLQINSREDVAKVLHDLRERMVKAEESGRGVDDVRGQLETMKRDLTEANRRLAELGATRTETLSGDDARLRQYVAKDGGVRLAGGYDQETRQHLPGLLDDVSEDANHAWQREAQRIDHAMAGVAGLLRTMRLEALAHRGHLCTWFVLRELLHARWRRRRWRTDQGIQHP